MADDKTFTKAELDAAVEAAMAKVNDKLEELQSKNGGLLDDLKKAQREARAAKEIKPEDLQAAEERADKAEAELAKVQKTATEATKAAEKATKALETESAFTQKLLIQDGLKSALIANGVKDEDFIDSLAAKFGSSASVKIDGENRTALIGDKPLPDAIKEWAATDAGKKFVAAPANGGGGAQGSSSSANGKQVTRSTFDAMGQVERSAFAKEGGKVVDA